MHTCSCTAASTRAASPLLEEKPRGYASVLGFTIADGGEFGYSRVIIWNFHLSFRPGESGAARLLVDDQISAEREGLHKCARDIDLSCGNFQAPRVSTPDGCVLRSMCSSSLMKYSMFHLLSHLNRNSQSLADINTLKYKEIERGILR